MKDKYDDMNATTLRGSLKANKLGPSGRWRADCTVAEARAELRAHDARLGKGGLPPLPDLPPVPDSLKGRGDAPYAPNPELTKKLEDVAEARAAKKPCWTDPITPATTEEDELAKAMAAMQNAIGNRPKGISEERVREIAAENQFSEKLFQKWLDKHSTSPTILVKRGERPAIEMNRQHYKFPLLAACADAPVPVNVMLVGGAGSGKTTIASAVAKATERKFSAISFGPMSSKGDLFGIRDATGKYHESELVKMVKCGGTFLGDETDAANAGTLTQINMILSNGHMSTPEGMIEKHEDFWFVAGCNTFGTGANRQYVGRNQLDAATLDRFFMIDFPVDTGLEAYACGLDRVSPRFKLDQGGVPTVDEWFEHVQRVRQSIEKLEIRHVVSPRASIMGANLIAQEVGKRHLEDGLIWKGLDTATRKKVEQHMNN